MITIVNGSLIKEIKETIVGGQKHRAAKCAIQAASANLQMERMQKHQECDLAGAALHSAQQQFSARESPLNQSDMELLEELRIAYGDAHNTVNHFDQQLQSFK